MVSRSSRIRPSSASLMIRPSGVEKARNYSRTTITRIIRAYASEGVKGLSPVHLGSGWPIPFRTGKRASELLLLLLQKLGEAALLDVGREKNIIERRARVCG